MLQTNCSSKAAEPYWQERVQVLVSAAIICTVAMACQATSMAWLLTGMAGMTVVLANGTIARCSATENPNLFWALRGSGSNYSVVASYDFATFAAPTQVTYFSMPAKWNTTTAPVYLAAVENYTKVVMPANLTMRMFASSYQHYFEGLYYGDVAGLIQFYNSIFSGSYPSSGFDFLDNWVSNVTAPLPKDDWGMYINYADPRLNRTTAGQTYYGKSLPRLQNLKAVYDPSELFYYPQSMQPVAV